jgi:nicotinamidase-related amidase
MEELPRFATDRAVGDLYVERAGEIADAAIAWADDEGVTPAASDETRICAFGIDVQVAFALPQGSLFVPGAVADTERTLQFLYRNLEKITTLVLSLDTHRAHQIFHPSFWRGAEGGMPAPFTVIRARDVRFGRWRAAQSIDEDAALDYVERLEASGKYVLTIWPFHALRGGLSSALVPQIMELSLFHATARQQPTVFVTKGEHPWTENFSVLSPEVQEVAGTNVGSFDERLFETLMSHDKVYVFGQAKSHCVLSTLLDLRARIEKTDRALARRIYVLSDAMSSVPPPPLDPLPPELDFPAIADAALEELASFGMNVVTTRAAI